jgi:hypothetical protein
VSRCANAACAARGRAAASLFSRQHECLRGDGGAALPQSVRNA